MHHYIWDAALAQTPEQAHAQIAAALEFPAYYGGNLDALWDCLTELQGSVTIQNAAAAEQALGEYGVRLLQTFAEATICNACLCVSFEDPA